MAPGATNHQSPRGCRLSQRAPSAPSAVTVIAVGPFCHFTCHFRYALTPPLVPLHTLGKHQPGGGTTAATQPQRLSLPPCHLIRLPVEVMGMGSHLQKSIWNLALTLSILLSAGRKTGLDNCDDRPIWPRSTDLTRLQRRGETPPRRAKNEGTRARREIEDAQFVRPVLGSARTPVGCQLEWPMGPDPRYGEPERASESPLLSCAAQCVRAALAWWVYSWKCEGYRRHQLVVSWPASTPSVCRWQVGYLLKGPFSIETLWRSLICPPDHRRSGQCLPDSRAIKGAEP